MRDEQSEAREAFPGPRVVHVKIDINNLIDLTEDFENHDQPEAYETLEKAIWKANKLLSKSEVGPSVKIILTVVNEPYTGED